MSDSENSRGDDESLLPALQPGPFTVERIRALSALEDETNYTIETLRRQWRRICDPKDTDIEGLRRFTDRMIRADGDPLLALSFYVEVGLYPHPFLLHAAALSIRDYLNAGGEKSLDEAFFGRRHSKNASSPRRRRKRNEFAYLHALLESTEGEIKQLDIAKEYLASPVAERRHKSKDPEDLLRLYRRWRAEYR